MSRFVEDELGIWAQLEFKRDYPFKNSELDTIAAIRKVMRYGIIDNAVLYECGLYVCMIAWRNFRSTTRSDQ